MKPYYNTNHLHGEDLTIANKKAKGQEEIILEFFKNNPNKQYSPPEVHRQTGLEANNAPLTSIRRAMTNLTGSQDLIKTSTMIEGPYKYPIHKWELNKQKYPQQGELVQLNIFE